MIRPPPRSTVSPATASLPYRLEQHRAGPESCGSCGKGRARATLTKAVNPTPLHPFRNQLVRSLTPYLKTTRPPRAATAPPKQPDRLEHHLAAPDNCGSCAKG